MKSERRPRIARRGRATHSSSPPDVPHGLEARGIELAGEPYVIISWPLQPARLSRSARFAGLSVAEREVAELLLEGRSNAEIAALRATNIGTTRKQIESVYRKLGVGSRSQLAALDARSDDDRRSR